MSIIVKRVPSKAYKPFDIVSLNDDFAVGFITEVDVNDSQPSNIDQISYAINWLTKTSHRTAWFNHSDLVKHCNLFVKIAESTCEDECNKEYIADLMPGLS